jgi:hypothetical protein
MKIKKKLLAHGILALLLVSSFVLTVDVSSKNASAAPDTHTWDGGGANALASTKENWVGDVAAPETGDTVVFDAGALPCTWDLAIALPSFTISVGYTGTITQGAVDFSYIDFSQASGTYAGSTTQWQSCSGTMSVTGGSLTAATLRLRTTGNNQVLSWGTSYWASLKSLDITGTGITSLTTSTGRVAITGGVLTVASGSILSIAGTGMETVNVNNIDIAGQITGSGVLCFRYTDAGFSVSVNNIIAPLTLSLHAVAGADRTLSVTETGTCGPLTISSEHASRTITLDTTANNYNIIATDITIGMRGILNARSSTITCSGNWDSSSGTFTRGYSSVYLTGVGKTLKTNTEGFWNLVFPYGSSTTLQSHVWAEAIGVSGSLTQAGKLINVSGASEFALTATGSWDGDIYLNGTGTNYTIPIIVPFTPTGRIFSKVHTTYINDTSGQLTVTPPLGVYGGIRLSRINMNYFEPANWTYTIASGNVQFELILKPHYTYQLYADGLSWGLPVDTGVDGIAYWTYSGWSMVTFNVTGTETVVIVSDTTTILTFILALSFGFGLMALGFKDKVLFILAGFVWIFCGIAIYVVYDPAFMYMSIGLGLILLFEGAYDVAT